MPVLFGSGVQGQYDYLVINLLGASLDSLYRQSSKKVMDLRSVCCIAMQVVGIDSLCEVSFFSILTRSFRYGDWRRCTTEGCYTVTYNWATA